MRPQIIVDKVAGLVETFASLLEAEARAAVAARGVFTLALPGGSVATTFFPRLSQADLDWSRVSFFWGDERAVPVTHPDSNCGLARALWLAPARVPEERIHPMPADTPRLAEAATRHGHELEFHLGRPPRLDLAWLGVGPDGHVCSLFPGHALLAEEQAWVAAIEDAPKAPARRLTLTRPALAAARMLVVAALGASKAEAVRESLEDPECTLPLALVTARATRCLFVLDEQAAGLLAQG